MFPDERRNMKLAARKTINGKVLSVFLAVILAGIITLSINVIGTIVDSVYKSDTVTAIFSVLSFLGYIFQGFLSVGFCVYLLKLTGTGNQEISDIFSEKNHFVNILKTTFVITLYVFIGLILLIVPGIIMALKYSQTYFILSEHPEYTYKQAMNESAKLMEGHKWEFLIFNLSFILWWIAVPFTFFLLLIYLLPYESTANANYYRYIKYKVYGDSTTVFDHPERIEVKAENVF